MCSSVNRKSTNYFNPTGIIDWSPLIEQILEKGRKAIKQTEHGKFTTLTSLLIHGP